jgi:hypothetical protein
MSGHELIRHLSKDGTEPKVPLPICPLSGSNKVFDPTFDAHDSFPGAILISILSTSILTTDMPLSFQAACQKPGGR